MRSLPGSTLHGRSSASGASASSSNALEGCSNNLAAGGQPAFPPSVVVAVKALSFRPPRRPSHEPATLQLSSAGVLDRRQRLIAPWRRAASADSKPDGPISSSFHTPIHGSWLNQVEIYFSV